MPVSRLDHVTIRTRDVASSVAFYRDIVGLEPGPRPEFSFDGAWLYVAGRPAVHLVGREGQRGGGVIDHFALLATGLAGYVSRLRENGIPFALTVLPPGVPQSGTKQLFFEDPDGARIELDFSPGEEMPADV